jgi:DNA-binding response OmpR family regulator
MANSTVLIVDDDRKLIELVRVYLEKDGYRVVAAKDGQEALRLARSQAPNLVVLDWLLPGMSGLEVCRAVRAESNVPIIMLTAMASEEDKLIGLDLGADDYLTKPFSPRELLARIRALLRRVSETEQGLARAQVGSLTVDPRRHEVSLRGESIDLTPTEFKLLATLMQQPGRVFSRLQLVDQVFGSTYDGLERSVDEHIMNLRRKIETDPSHPQLVLTAYGVGYKMSERADA